MDYTLLGPATLNNLARQCGVCLFIGLDDRLKAFPADVSVKHPRLMIAIAAQSHGIKKWLRLLVART